MKESLTSFENRIAAEEFYLDSMCTISPNTVGIKRIFIQLRPQPDPSYDQVSIKVRVGDGLFRSPVNFGVYSVPDLKLIAGEEVLSPNQYQALLIWATNNLTAIQNFWSDENFSTYELFEKLISQPTESK